MSRAIGAVEAAAMDLEALRIGLDVGGAVLQVADETMQVSLGVLERRGFVDEGATGGAVLDELVEVGEVSEAGDGFSDLPRLAEAVMAQQRKINASWGAVRATAIERAAGADRGRKREIEEAVAYVDNTLGAVAQVATFDPVSLLDHDPATLAGRSSSLLNLLVADELARLDANIDAATGHGSELRRAAEKEQLQAALEWMATLVEQFDSRISATRPSPSASLNESDQAGTSTADALAAQQAAADVLVRVSLRAEQARESMTAALVIELHEPARSVLHGPGGGREDVESMVRLTEALARREADHAGQVRLLQEV